MLNKIGFYQLDNLINNRVPFLFLNLSGNSLVDWYTVLSRLHVQTFEVMLAEADIQAELDNRKVPTDHAIVLLCPDGTLSMKIYGELSAKHYTNVYVIDGGYQQLMTEKGQI